jgi:hypothetical protein
MAHPLALAVTRDKPQMVRFLLERDADHTLRSPEGRTLFEIAQQKGHQTIADMLREIGS